MKNVKRTPSKKPKVKRLGHAVMKIADMKYLGEEPKHLSDTPMTQTEIANTFTWYGYASDGKTEVARDYVLEYLKEQKVSKETLRKFRSFPHEKLSLSTGWICRQMSLGSKFPIDLKRRALTKIKEIVARKEGEKVVTEEQPVNIQERIQNKTNNILTMMEEQYDAFALSSYETLPKHYEWMQGNGVNPGIAAKIVSHFTPRMEEVKEAYSPSKKTHKQIVEAYKGFTKPVLKKIIAWYESLMKDCASISVAAKTVRKPRKKKEPSAAAKVKGVKYKAEDATYKIKSDLPVNILGSTQVWTFNTKTRVLSVYNAPDNSPLGIKGTTIIGFDESTSVSKKLRKPETVLPDLLKGSKASLKKFMKDIKTLEVKATGRINTDTVILKVVK